MSEGPFESLIAVAGLVLIAIFALWKGQTDVALASTAALAAYIGAKVVTRPHPQQP